LVIAPRFIHFGGRLQKPPPQKHKPRPFLFSIVIQAQPNFIIDRSGHLITEICGYSAQLVMDEMGSTPSHEANALDAAAPAADAASAPLLLPPTSHESKAANQTTASSVKDKTLAPDLKRKLGTRDEEAHATKAGPKAKRKKTQKASTISSTEPDTVSSMAPADDPIDFTDIKEWIAAYEANPQPSSLTPAQRKAVLDLKGSIAQNVAAPEIGDEDYISALLSRSFSFFFQVII
jgi:hypothetical protein